MKKRVVFLAVGVSAALSLACGPQPSTYLVALDQSGLASLPGTCYATGAPPTNPPVIQALIQHEFTFWEGAQGKKFLRMDTVTVQFPSSGFSFNGLQDGGPKQWTYSTTADRGNNTSEARKMVLDFTDLSATMVGTIAVTDAFTCNNPPCGFQDCSVTLNLNGRQVEAQYTGQL
jgi:hypothetical protein